MNWVTIDIEEVLNGKRVGFQNPQDGNDISNTGIGMRAGKFTDTETQKARDLFRTKIGNCQVYFDDDGNVVKTIPNNSPWDNDTLMMVDTVVTKTRGTSLKPVSGGGGGDEEVVDLSEMQPRDEFAMTVLGMLIEKMPDPAGTDDANILYTCRAAYRWANGMIAAAAEARSGVTTDYEEVEEGNVKVNVTITNNSSDAITIAPMVRFVLSTEGTKSPYPYNRTEHGSLGDSDITIASGQTVSYSDVTIPGNSKQYDGQHFAEYNEIAGNWPNNVLLYDPSGNSGTIVPKMINPSTIFTDGGTYNIVYGTSSQQQNPM